MKVSLNNFRAFAQTPDVEIRPLTILVGENSSGKTSFLAALRFAFELSRTEATSFFNVYPFDLGPYEDIVHSSSYPGTDKRFSVTIEKFIDTSKDRQFRIHTDEDKEEILARATFFFRSNYGDTVLSSVRIVIDDDNQMDLHLTEQGSASLTLGGQTFSLGQDDLFALPTGRPAYSVQTALYMLMSFRFRERSSKSDTQASKTLDRFSAIYDAFISSNHEVVSSPPVRSVPKKVYTGSDDSGDQGGSAPYELSKLKRSDARRWGRINNGLSRFGRQSGLFSKFDIKKLTQQNSGPFQVKVTVRNRASTIADVGYGVSQSLPIMTDLIVHASQTSALLLQQPEVHLHPRAQAELGTMFAEFVTTNSKGFIVAETHSDHLIDRIRIEIREKRLSPSLLNIVFFCSEGNNVDIHQISVDSQGNLVGAPPSYRQFFIREQERVLGF